MKKIISKTQLVLILSAFLVACGGGGGSGSSNSSASVNNNVVNPNNGNSSESNGHEAALRELREKEARQEAERKAAERKKQEAQKAQEEAKKLEDEKNKAEQPKDEPKAEEPKVEEPKVDEPKVDEPKVEEPKVEEPKVEEPKVEEPKVDEPKVDEPKVDEPKADEPKPQNDPTYTGHLLSTYSDRNDNSWNGKNSDYHIDLKDGKFDAIIVEGRNGNSQILPLGKAGYYGQVTFTSDVTNPDSVVGDKMKAQITDLVYAYVEKDTVNPAASMNYEGKLLYSIEKEASDEAHLSLTYHTDKQNINGIIIGSHGSSAINMSVESGKLSGGDIIAEVKPNKGHAYSEMGNAILNGHFLEDGKYIVGDVKSDDMTGNKREWRGVFGAEGTPRPNN